MHRTRRWLQDVPLADLVDRRNAPMLQIVLLLIAVPIPLLWLYRILGTGLAWRPGETLSLATGLLLSAVALFSFMLVRRGRLQWAIRQLLVLVAAVLLVTYALKGMSPHVFELPLQVMWLFVAGMMIGRRALWAMYAVLAAALAVGAISEARMLGEALPHLLGDAVIRSVMFLVIAVVVDRTTRSLRESLNEANERGRKLEVANQRLEAEIVAREQAQDQLLHAQKIETVGHMASGIAHDFNHVLSLILGYAERAKTAEVEDELRQAVDGMESAARRASALTHGLLTFSRYDATRAQRFDAGEALDEVLPMLRQALGPRIALEVRRAAGPSPVVFDRVQFGLVLLNLATNAAQAMPGGGRVELGLETGTGPDRVRIWMRDGGPGIPVEVQARMFEPFFTTKPAGQGTGLGLAIVHNQVTAFDGLVHVESAEGTGTLVTIELPLAGEGDRPEARSPAYQASM
ncbi:MAG TPA: ATP-binding protein [Pseudomonas sp.]|nr:ATP-binding protein [Pseudomonas sp.]